MEKLSIAEIRKKEYRHRYYIETEKPRRQAKPKMIRQCLICGNAFTAISSQKYCKSISCRNEYKKQRQIWTYGWRERNKNYIQQYNFITRDRMKSKEYNKQYRQTLKGKLSHRLNQLKRQRGDKGLTLELAQRVYEDNIKKYGTLTCILCNNSIEFGQDSLEHKTPIIRGGTNQYKNLGIAHRLCNSQKNDKTMEEWRKYYGEIISC